MVPGDVRVQLCEVALQVLVRPRRGRLLHTRRGGCCNRDRLLVVPCVCVCEVCVWVCAMCPLILTHDLNHRLEFSLGSRSSV